MPDTLKPLDPNFPQYGYTKSPLTRVKSARAGGKQVANLFMGEWVKVLDGTVPARGRVHVQYRGGKGYIDRSDFGYTRLLEVFFIDVNQGDSILIQTPDDRRILIDGGEGDEAHRFIRDKYNLHKKTNYIDFEAVIATHCDADHTKGLIRILKDRKIAVKRVYHNGLLKRKSDALFKGLVSNGRVSGLLDDPNLSVSPALSPLMKSFVKAVREAKKNLPAVIREMEKQPRWKGRIDLPAGGFVFKRLDASDRFVPPYDDRNKYLTVEVLWPVAANAGGKKTLPWYGDVGKTVNGNSIVLALDHGRNRIMLTGDLNDKSMEDILKHYKKGGKKNLKRLRSDVFKAAHHGSQDFSLPFLKTVKPNAAVISSGDNKQDVHGHPRAVLMGTITRYSRVQKPAVFSTELAACFNPITVKKSVRDKYFQGRGQMHEKSFEGIVHLRSDRRKVYMGTVFGRKPKGKPMSYKKWKWDIWPEG